MSVQNSTGYRQSNDNFPLGSLLGECSHIFPRTAPVIQFLEHFKPDLQILCVQLYSLVIITQTEICDAIR